jgi:hypothetical protein
MKTKREMVKLLSLMSNQIGDVITDYSDQIKKVITDYEKREYIDHNSAKVGDALKIAYTYSQIDGAHHKAWVIDQMLRALLEDNYSTWIKKYCYNTGFSWDVGIAP